MASFRTSYLEIESRELVRHLLRGAGQCDREYVNPRDLLDFLKLRHTSFHFATELPEEALRTLAGASPRALLSFSDRLIATDDTLKENRIRFSVLHEIGHYVLPRHEHALYLCDDVGLTFATRLVLEKEANEFAADLLFLGDRFTAEANCRPISALSVKELAERYRASFEATARRVVEKSFRPCMVVAFKHEDQRAVLDASVVPQWTTRYSVASPLFKAKYFEKLTGTAPPEAVAAVTRPGRDIADSHICDLDIPSRVAGSVVRFHAEFFSNTYNVFCLLTPASVRG